LEIQVISKNKSCIQKHYLPKLIDERNDLTRVEPRNHALFVLFMWL